MIRAAIKKLLKALHLFKPVYRIIDRIGGDQRRWQHHAAAYGLKVVFKKRYIAVNREMESIRVAPQHEVYLCDMIKYFDYYHGAVHSVNGMVDYSKPAIQRLMKSGVKFEFPSLPESDDSTEVYLEHLKIQEGNIVFDLGAYAGSSSYVFSKLAGPHGLVVAFEPDAENFKYFQKNILRHSLTNVRAFRKGVWSSNCTIEFQTEGNMGSSIASITERRSNVKSVEVVTLDKALELAGVDTVHAIKMDIEGAELEVLRSAREFLQRHRPRMVIEPHFVDGKMCTDELLALLTELGYSTQLATQGAISDWPLVVAIPV